MISQTYSENGGIILKIESYFKIFALNKFLISTGGGDARHDNKKFK